MEKKKREALSSSYYVSSESFQAHSLSKAESTEGLDTDRFCQTMGPTVVQVAKDLHMRMLN